MENALVRDVVCDENTILPDGSEWTLDVDWSLFGALTDFELYFKWRESQRNNDGNSAI